MKVREYLDLCDKDYELTCLDNDWDCEFYLYNYSNRSNDYPNYHAFMDYLINNLEILRIYDGAVVVNLYLMLDNKKVLEKARGMYEESDYNDYDDLLELLMEDCLTNINNGYEGFSRDLLEILKDVYGE